MRQEDTKLNRPLTWIYLVFFLTAGLLLSGSRATAAPQTTESEQPTPRQSTDKPQERGQKKPKTVNSRDARRSTDTPVKSYSIRMMIVDPEKRPVVDAEVWSIPSFKPQKTNNGVEFEIDAANKPVDGKLVVYARLQSALLSGSKELKLANISNLSATLELTPEERMLNLHVQDLYNNPLKGVMLSTTLPNTIPAMTDDSGNCQLVLHNPVSVNAEVELVLVVTGTSDLAIMYPWQQKVFFIENLTQKVILAQRDKESLFGSQQALRTMASQVNAGAMPKATDEAPGSDRREAALKIVAGWYKVTVPELDKALRSLAGKDNNAYDQALGHLYEGNLSEAERLFKVAIDENEATEREAASQEADGWSWLGQTLYEQQRYSEAVTALTSAMEKKPNDSTILNRYGLALFADGQMQKAEEVYLKLVNRGKDPCSCPDVSAVYNLATVYQRQAKYDLAQPLFNQALELGGKQEGVNSTEYALYLDGKAQNMVLLGNVKGAEPLFLHAWSIRKEKLAPDDPAIASSLHNLGVYYRLKNRFVEAERYLKQSLGIYEKNPKVDRLSLMLVKRNLADLYMSQDDFKAAEPLVYEALSLAEPTLRADHLEMANLALSLAPIYENKGKTQEAVGEYQKALKIQVNNFGADSVIVAGTKVLLASQILSHYDYANAKRLFEEALTVLRASSTPDHIMMANALTGLSGLNMDNGAHDVAEKQASEALELVSKTYGPESFECVQPHLLLAAADIIRGDYARAEARVLKAKGIAERIFGKGHINTNKALQYLSSIYSDQNKYLKAQPLLEQSLNIIRNRWGSEDPQVAEPLNNLAWNLFLQNKPDQGRPYAEQAVRIARKDESPSVAAYLDTLANISASQGRYAEAESIFKDAIEHWKKLPDDPTIAITFRALATLYVDRGRNDEAEQLLKDAITIQKLKLPDTPELAKTMTLYATFLRKMNRQEEAAIFARDAKAINSRNSERTRK